MLPKIERGRVLPPALSDHGDIYRSLYARPFLGMLTKSPIFADVNLCVC